jgi:hypothetical protein
MRTPRRSRPNSIRRRTVLREARYKAYKDGDLNLARNIAALITAYFPTTVYDHVWLLWIELSQANEFDRALAERLAARLRIPFSVLCDYCSLLGQALASLYRDGTRPDYGDVRGFHIRTLLFLLPVEVYEDELRRMAVEDGQEPMLHLRAFGAVVPDSEDDQHETREVSVAAIRARSETLDWEVLPPGWLQTVASCGFPHRKGQHPRSLRDDQIERLAFINGLRPRRWYQGARLNKRVFLVAEFDGVVVADTIAYGNALYYYRGPDDHWRSVLKVNKSAALARGARRIEHRSDWKQQIAAVVRGEVAAGRDTSSPSAAERTRFSTRARWQASLNSLTYT